MVAGDERVSLKDAVNRVKQRERESDNFRDVFIRQKKGVSRKVCLAFWLSINSSLASLWAAPVVTCVLNFFLQTVLFPRVRGE